MKEYIQTKISELLEEASQKLDDKEFEELLDVLTTEIESYNQH